MIQLSVQISAKEESPDTHCSIGIVSMEAPISDTVKTMSKIGLMLMEHIDRYTAKGG